MKTRIYATPATKGLKDLVYFSHLNSNNNSNNTIVFVFFQVRRQTHSRRLISTV